MYQMFGARQPVSQNFEKSLGPDVERNVQIFCKRMDGSFVDFEEQSLFATEMLEDRTLGDAQGGGDIPHTSVVVPSLREVLRSGLDDACALGFRAGPELGLALV